MADLTHRLPVETLVSALGYLTESELRRVARTSRRLRAVALAHTSFCVRFAFSNDSLQQNRSWDDLQAVTAYVSAHRLRLDLLIYYCEVPEPSKAAVLVGCLEEALSHLVKLSLEFTKPVPAELLSALGLPAPQLRHLRFECYYDGHPPPPLQVIPSDIFGRQCGKLMSLSLRDVALPSPGTVAAFARIRHVVVNYPRLIIATNVAAHFPAVRDLTTICAGGDCEDVSPVFNLRGLSLERLTAKIKTGGELCDKLLSEIDEQLAAFTYVVPVVRRYHSGDLWRETVWKDSEMLNMRVHENCGWTEAAIISTSRNVCRMNWLFYRCESEFEMSEPLDGHRVLANRLVYVRVEDRFLAGFLQFRFTMPVLRRLQIDFDGFRNMVWPPYHNEECYDGWSLDEIDRLSSQFDPGSKLLHYLPCPTLDELVITSPMAGCTADSREAAHLGRALRQTERPRGERARLVLCGVTWNGAVLHDLLARAFSSVVLGPFTKDDPDGNLWDPCFE
ncbi:hypothetical protein AURDEDRAFT_166518 [Auricularia subglabra TFB-10046 SS5]|nr:hypothetical protein AURDEDRAFT_166518 [Auricularia subglabra TFB-10046 SS5]